MREEIENSNTFLGKLINIWGKEDVERATVALKPIIELVTRVTRAEEKRMRGTTSPFLKINYSHGGEEDSFVALDLLLVLGIETSKFSLHLKRIRQKCGNPRKTSKKEDASLSGPRRHLRRREELNE